MQLTPCCRESMTIKLAGKEKKRNCRANVEFRIKMSGEKEAVLANRLLAWRYLNRLLTRTHTFPLANRYTRKMIFYFLAQIDLTGWKSTNASKYWWWSGSVGHCTSATQCPGQALHLYTANPVQSMLTSSPAVRRKVYQHPADSRGDCPGICLVSSHHNVMV